MMVTPIHFFSFLSFFQDMLKNLLQHLLFRDMAKGITSSVVPTAEVEDSGELKGGKGSSYYDFFSVVLIHCMYSRLH